MRIPTPHVSPKPDANIDQARLRPHLRSGSSTIAGTHIGRIHNVSTGVKDPQDLRGIPVIGRGVGGTSPRTNPEAETIYRLTPRRVR